jgi:putative SOS response-associated peptidase YedK
MQAHDTNVFEDSYFAPSFNVAPQTMQPVVRLDSETGQAKQPYAIALKDGSLFAFAGLWETWNDKTTGKSLETYTVIATVPNELMESPHNRMPVILHRQDYERRLAPADPAQLPVHLLRPYPADEMRAWKVGSDVGNVRNNRPELIEPIANS